MTKKELIKKIKELKEDNLDYVDSGTYDTQLVDYAQTDDEELNTAEDRREAFFIFAGRADYGEYENLAFTDGYNYAINNILELLNN